MVLSRTLLLRYLLLSAILFLLLITSLRLPQTECGSYWQPCERALLLVPEEWAELDEAPPLAECPGQSFQAWRLLQHLKASLTEDDVLLEEYLLGWDQLLRFMDSLGTMVSFFSHKVKEKTEFIRQLSTDHENTARKPGAYHSVRSMVEAELKGGVVSFEQRSPSGCRTLLRLHRSLLWLRLLLEGLAEGPDGGGNYLSPGELASTAYEKALAPHHPWLLRRAAALLFLHLPDRNYFLRLVCVTEQREATPTLRRIITALTLVHQRTQRILEDEHMTELP